MDCSLPGSSLHGILQARVLEWGAISFSRGSSQPRDQTQVSRILGRCFNLWATREAPIYILDANNSCWLRKREKGREESGLFFVSLRLFISINIPRSCQYKLKVDVLPEETCCGLALWSWKSHLAYFELFWSFEICAGSMTRSLRSHSTSLLYDLCNFHLEVINELIKEMK